MLVRKKQSPICSILGSSSLLNFLFQTRHRGWPDSLELESYIEQGAQYLLATDTDDFYHYLLAHYSLVYQDEDGYIFNLQVPVATASSSIME